MSLSSRAGRFPAARSGVPSRDRRSGDVRLSAAGRSGDVDVLLRVKDAARILSTGPGEAARASVVDTAAPRVAVSATYSSPSAASVDQPTESVRSLRAQFEAPPNVVSGIAYNGRAVPASAAAQSVARQPTSGGAYGKIEEAILARNTPVTETEKIMLVIRRATVVCGANQSREREPTTAALPVTDDERGHVLIVRPTIVLHMPPATLPVAAGACDVAAAAMKSPTSASRDVTSRPGSGHTSAKRGPSAVAATVVPPAAALSPDNEAVSVVTPSQLRRGAAAAAFWPPPPPPTTPAECGSTEVDSGTPRDDDSRLVTPSSLRRGAATAAFWQQPPPPSTPGRSSEAKSPSDYGGVDSNSPMLVAAVAAEQSALPRTASGPATVADAAGVRPFAVAHLSTAEISPAATSSAGIVAPTGAAAAKATETSSVHFQSPMVFRVPPSQGAAAAAPTASGQSGAVESPRGAVVSRRWNDLSPAGSLPVTDCEKADVVMRRPTIVLTSSDARVADFRSHEISELNTRLQVPERPDELTISDSPSINGLDPQALSKSYGRALFQIVHSPVTPPTEVVTRFGMKEFVISKRLLAVSECED